MYEVQYSTPGSYAVQSIRHAGFYKLREDAENKLRKILRESAPYTLVWVQDTETLESLLTYYNDDDELVERDWV